MPAPATSSRHLYTGRHQGHTQAAPWLGAREVPRSPLSRGPGPILGFGAVLKVFDASAVVHTRSSSRRSPDPVLPGLFPKRSPRRLLTAAASGGLGSPPARRTRRANLHHWHSTVRAGGFYVTITLLSGHTTSHFPRPRRVDFGCVSPLRYALPYTREPCLDFERVRVGIEGDPQVNGQWFCPLMAAHCSGVVPASDRRAFLCEVTSARMSDLRAAERSAAVEASSRWARSRSASTSIHPATTAGSAPASRAE